MLTLFTNYPEFRNDIAEVIRLFTDISEIIFCDDKASVSQNLVIAEIVSLSDKSIATVHCNINDIESDYTYTYNAAWQTDLERKRYLKRCVKIAVYRALIKLYKVNLPWGSLTGIRPTRLLRELSERIGEKSAERLMIDEFNVSRAKFELVYEINSIQEPLLDRQPLNSVDIYVGIPFCVSRCLYCSFASEVRTEKTDVSAYINALIKDISNGANIVKNCNLNIRNVYIGGGTPTSLTTFELDMVLTSLCKSYNLGGKEFTVEAGRPDTIDAEKLKCMKSFGVNRISINPQTMNDCTLKLMGRTHTSADTEAVFHLAREIGFESINMDVICGLPVEQISDMDNTLSRISKLSPDNLTVHTLALKRSSRLVERIADYTLSEANTVIKMTELGEEYARVALMRPYYMYRQKYMRGSLENIGYSLKDKECVYNIDMMEDTTSIMSHGANSMTKRVSDAERRVMRIPNPKDVATYITKLDSIIVEKHKLFENGTTD